MKNSATFDLPAGPFIHLIWPLMLFSELFFGCSKHSQPPVRPVADGGVSVTDDFTPQDQPALDSGLSALPMLDKDSVEGVFRTDQNGSGTVALEIGSAPKGHDISLSRQLAAARARANLLTLLKSKELVSSSTESIQGVTIERYWMSKGRIYALARLELQDQNITNDLNVRGSTSSNASEDKAKDTATPQGGAEK